MSSSETPSMTSTYSSTPTMLKQKPPFTQNISNTNYILNTPFIILFLCIISITIICIIYNIVCVNIKKKKIALRERIIQNSTQQFTMIQPVVHENPLHSVYRINV
jgi:hypothetical protein